MNEYLLTKMTFIKRVTALALLMACSWAIAAEDVWHQREANQLWTSECGCCHMAFPPALLAKDDWHILMEGLDKHFGVNASLDTKSSDEIAAYLERYAGSSWSYSSDSQRITETNWFVKKHQASIRLVQKGRIKNLVDCVACHK